MEALENNPRISLSDPKTLQIKDGAKIYYGANQAWYPTYWQRQAGCGPTVSAMVLFYLAQTNPLYQKLCPYTTAEKESFLVFMETLWRYVTPGIMGADSAALIEGIKRYGSEKGFTLTHRILHIKAALGEEAQRRHVVSFIQDAFLDDLPVMFLNHSNGDLNNLENWHWVTLVSLDKNALLADMYDQGQYVTIDLSLWLRTTKRSGWLVAIEAASES